MHARKGIGTKDALVSITSYIYEQLDKSIPVAAIFLDLAKALDIVDHKLLLKKLHSYGIRGTPEELIESYR